jgi:hypothetical protein
VVLKKSKNRFWPLIRLLTKSKNQVKELTLDSWFFDKPEVINKTNDLDNTGILILPKSLCPALPSLPKWISFLETKKCIWELSIKTKLGCSKLHSRSWSPYQEHNQTFKSFIDDVDNTINLWTPPNTDANATAEII